MSIISILELAGVAHLPRSRQLIESLVLVEGYKEAQVEFGSIAVEAEAKQAIDQFRDLVNRNQVQGNERNIDHWRKQGWDKFSAFVKEKSQEKSKREEAKDQGRSITIHEDANWLVVVPIDKAASCFHGRNTDWCTTKPYARWFEDYVYKNHITLIYFLKLDSGDKWAIAVHSFTDKIEMFDRRDNKITKQQFQQQTGFDPVEYRNRVVGSEEIQQASTEARNKYVAAHDRILNAFDDGIEQRDVQIERDLLFVKDVQLIVSYCRAIGQRWPKAEPIIAKDAQQAAVYAIHVVKQRWPEGEKEIMKYNAPMLDYMEAFINGRWPAAEQYMIDKKRALSALRYAVKTIGERWPEAENMVIQRGDDMIEEIEQAYLAGDGPKLDELDDQLEMLRSAIDKYTETFMGGNWPEASRIYDYDVPA